MASVGEITLKFPKPTASNNQCIPPQVTTRFKRRKPRMRVIRNYEVFRFRRLPEEEEFDQHMDQEDGVSSGSEIKARGSPCKASSSSMEGNNNNTNSPQHDHPLEYEAYSPQSSDDYDRDRESCQLDFDDDSCFPEPEEEESEQIDDYGEPYFPEPEEESEYISESDEFSGSQVKPFCSPCNDDDTSESDAVDSISDSCYPVSSPEPLSPPRPAAYFDCKLCVKMAREPVVAPCGHLFCGDCLDKWLHFFTSEMQCPVCRSKVLDSSIIPISSPPWWQHRA